MSVGLAGSVYFFSAATLLLAQSAFAQETNVEETVEENGTNEESVTVSQQKGCVILIKNAQNLKVNSKVKLSQTSGQNGVALVKGINPKGVARAVLSKKQCAKNFVGASVESSGAGKAESPKKLRELQSSETNAGQSSELPVGVAPDSSAHERMRRPFSIRAGMGLMFTPGVTLGAGYHFSHEFSVEGTWDSISANFLDLYKYDRMRFGALANYFTGNSFFLSGGLVYESFSNSLSSPAISESGLEATRDAFQSSISQIQYQFGIGNRWNFGGFFVGTEWLGYSKALTTLAEEYTTIDGYTETERDKDNTKSFADAGSVRLFNTHLGFSF